MKKTEIARLARSLMDQHGFKHVPFAWDRAKNRLGAAHFRRSYRDIEATKLTLSAHIMPLVSDWQVRDTILHEIAHLMTPGAHHGYEWKRACRTIGADPSRTAALPQDVREVLNQGARYVVSCQGCGQDFYYHRRPKHDTSLYRHKGCGGTLGPLRENR